MLGGTNYSKLQLRTCCHVRLVWFRSGLLIVISCTHCSRAASSYTKRVAIRGFSPCGVRGWRMVAVYVAPIFRSKCSQYDLSCWGFSPVCCQKTNRARAGQGASLRFAIMTVRATPFSAAQGDEATRSEHCSPKRSETAGRCEDVCVRCRTTRP